MPTRFRVGILYALLVACCLLLVAAPLVFRAPSGVRAGLRDAPVGGGPPASRPRRELRSARRLEARPGPATAHRHRGRSLRRPSHLWGLIADRRVASKPGQAPPPPTGTAARPSGPSGTLHTGRTNLACNSPRLFQTLNSQC